MKPTPNTTASDPRPQETGLPSAPSADDAWAAVLSRDPLADGQFVYAVSSTGIYCRPVCPSRRPRRKNVAFFPDPVAAESAGFRPCRRCRPEQSGISPTTACVERARAYLVAHLDESVTLEELGRAAYMSPFHLQRSFKRLLGVTPREYVRARRAERLKERLRAGDTVSRATYEAGFSSGSRVYERSNVELGMTPATYRRGGEGEQIRYSVVPFSLGWLLVALTHRGVCAVAMGDTSSELEAGLRREYPRAVLKRADDFEVWVSSMVDFAEGATAHLELPLDLRTTAFQQRVWKTLQEIPVGETRSYGEIAAAIGLPAGARAVAQACASNRIALAIPCHRVVRGDGEPGGYRWGADRKRKLLERERAATASTQTPLADDEPTLDDRGSERSGEMNPRPSGL
jgi:AraC family transcriptional regulator, regulatory protein of adaptative response / methylated-DNA-[protein]-cysteine methyltransferase